MINTPGPKQHIQQVDYIRAIASLGVALFHLGGKTLPVLNNGWLGVQMFFCYRALLFAGLFRKTIALKQACGLSLGV